MISFRGKVVTWGTRRLWQKYEEYIINYKIEILICFMYVNNFSSFPQVASCYECLPCSVAETFIRCGYMCGLQRPAEPSSLEADHLIGIYDTTTGECTQ